MDIEQYYKKVHSGDKVDNSELLTYIKSFPCIILWGASYLGKEIGKYLVNHNISIDSYWDMRADEIGHINEICVNSPFPDADTNIKQNTLIVLCIGNTAIHNNLMQRLREHGYNHILLGDKIFMGAVCPFDSTTGVNGLVCNGSMTCRSMFCSKLQNIVKNKYNHGGLFLENLTFMITTHCSLGCKYCVSYINSYPKERRAYFSYDQIARDIDAIFDNVDAVGSITVQGGEPFLHPDLDKIIKKLLEKRNFGILSIATNGIFKISKEKLEAFTHDSRLNVAFSGYYDALPKEKMDIFYNNIKLLKENNIPVTVGVRMPEWVIPPTLWDRHYSEDVMKSKKASCKIPIRCMQIMNGRLYPCLYSASLHGIGIADYSEDYITLEQEHLKEAIVVFMERPYYKSCGHCGGGGGSTNMAGEQGYYNFITPEESKK